MVASPAPETAKDHDVEFLRGVAALGVVIFHFCRSFFPPDGAGGGIPGISAAAPFIIAPLNGPFMVTLFFVLSGYVLSVKLIERDDPGRGALLIAKRFPRLLPLTLVGTLLSAALYLSGFMFNAEVSALTGSGWAEWSGGVKVAEGMPGISMTGAVADGFALFGAGYSQYNSALWTMRYELIASCAAIAVAMLIGSRRRVWLDAAIVVIIGTIALKVHALISISIAVVFVAKYIARHPPKVSPWLCGLLIAVGLALGSTYKLLPVDTMPDGQLRGLAERFNWLLHGAGALALFVGCRLLGNDVFAKVKGAQTLGRLSFPLYVLHLPLQASVASAIVLALGLNAVGLAAAFAVSLAVLVPLSFLLAGFDEWWTRTLNRNARQAQAMVSAVVTRGMQISRGQRDGARDAYVPQRPR